jgi:hypothetical protein
MRKVDFVGGILFLRFALSMIFFVVPLDGDDEALHGVIHFFCPMSC